MIKSITAALVCVMTFVHEFHVSHTTLSYNNDNQSIEITIKVAVEDLETSLREKGAKDLNIGSKKENKKAEEWVNNYFKQHLKLYSNDYPLYYSWIGKELSKDLHDLYIYFEIENCDVNGEIKSLSLENSIFTEVLPNQSNIVLFEFNEFKYNQTFTKSKTTHKFNLE